MHPYIGTTRLFEYHHRLIQILQLPVRTHQFDFRLVRMLFQVQHPFPMVDIQHGIHNQPSHKSPLIFPCRLVDVKLKIITLASSHSFNRLVQGKLLLPVVQSQYPMERSLPVHRQIAHTPVILDESQRIGAVADLQRIVPEILLYLVGIIHCHFHIRQRTGQRNLLRGSRFDFHLLLTPVQRHLETCPRSFSGESHQAVSPFPQQNTLGHLCATSRPLAGFPTGI